MKKSVVEVCKNCSCSKGNISKDQAKALKKIFLAKNVETLDHQGVRINFSECLELCKEDEHFDTSANDI